MNEEDNNKTGLTQRHLDYSRDRLQQTITEILGKYTIRASSTVLLMPIEIISKRILE